MPGIDGYETARRMKSELELYDVPILFLSALNDLSNIVQCFAAGGVDYISKPFKKEELLARVKTHLRIKHLQTGIRSERDRIETILNSILPERIINKLKKMGLDITKEFWYLIRGNIEILDDVKIWMNVCFGNIQTKNIDSDLLSLALKLLPHDQFNENTWSIWTNLLKIESGKKGKDLYKPLRLCLTGQDNGPEMANLISIMGRDKVTERLSFDT